MRVPPPGKLKLSAAALLQDVRDRLSDRLPAYARKEEDPADPGWLLMEQAAWMVEAMSDQLDRYPFAVVQQFVHLTGGQLLPALPALGVVFAVPEQDGVLSGEQPAPWRFFTAQTEQQEAVEFVPIEGDVPVRVGQWTSALGVDQGALWVVGTPEADDATTGQLLWAHPPRRAEVFDSQTVRYLLVATDTDALATLLEEAIGRLKERNIGWLALKVERLSAQRLAVVAKITPGRAFARTVPGGLAPGGDLVGDWGTLDDSTWTPVVQVRDDSSLPARLRGMRPIPLAEGQFVIPNVPLHYPVDRLLIARASPIPASVEQAIWDTLARLDVRLAPFKPLIRRELSDGEQSAWLAALLEAGVWERLSGPTTLLHVAFGGEGGAAVRVGLIVDIEAPERPPDYQIWALDGVGQLSTEPIPSRVVWRLPLPPRAGGVRMQTVVVVEVPTTDETSGLVFALAGGCVGALLNPVLVGNLPAVRDGRDVQIRRAVPEAVNLLFPDIVTEAVRERLLREAIPTDVAAQLRALRLAEVEVEGEAPILDWAGVAIDASEGRVTLLAPDPAGQARPLRTGTRLHFPWYRRTDGERGNVPAGSIEIVEQEPTARPQIVRVFNPLGTFYGAPREANDAAISRLFAPAAGTPVLPADFERQIRQTLGATASSWVIRCWSYAERTLTETTLWPPHDPFALPDPETEALRAQLAAAGPETLLVVIGPTTGRISPAELDAARRAIRRMVQQLSERLPMVRDAVVTGFWPLQLKGAPAPALLPCFTVERGEGTLIDATGRTAAVPRATLLNAAVVGVT